MAVGPALSARSRANASVPPGLRWTLSSTSGPPARYGGTLSYDPKTERVLLFGGYDDEAAFRGSRWTPVDVGVPPGSPSYRALHAMAYDSKRGVTWLYGGREPCDTLPSGEESCETLWFLPATGGIERTLEALIRRPDDAHTCRILRRFRRRFAHLCRFTGRLGARRTAS